MPQQTQCADDEVEGHLRRYLATREWKSTAIGYAIDNDINYRTFKQWLSGRTHPEVYKKFSPEERENFSVRGICTDREGAALLKQFADGDYKTVAEFTKKWDIQTTTFKAWISGKTRPQIRAQLSTEYLEKLDRLRPVWATPQSIKSALDHALNPKGNKYAWMKDGSAGIGSSTASTASAPGAPSASAPREQAQASKSKQPPAPSEPKEQVSTGRPGPTPSDVPQQPQPQVQLPKLAQGVALAARTRLPEGPTRGTSASACNSAASSSTTSYQGRKRAASPGGGGERKGFKPKSP